LGERSGLTGNYIGNLERGEQSPTLVALEAIAEALDMTDSEMINADLSLKTSVKREYKSLK